MFYVDLMHTHACIPGICGRGTQNLVRETIRRGDTNSRYGWGEVEQVSRDRLSQPLDRLWKP